MTLPDRPRLKVLVPDEIGLKMLASSTNLEAIRYEPGDPWPREHIDATVVVVGHENAAALGVRFVELPDLRLVQTLSAGYEVWLQFLPDGVMLSNARGAHGGSSAEWVVAVLLAVYRDLALFHEQQSEGVWRHRSSETLIGKRVVVLGAGAPRPQPPSVRGPAASSWPSRTDYGCVLARRARN